MVRSLVVLMLVSTSVAAMAQEKDVDATGETMGKLISEGYEIKAAVPNGRKFVVFLQKDSTGYACEMVTLTRSACGKIN